MAETTLTQSLPEPSPPEPWSITLCVTEGPHVGKAFTFAQHDTFLVGRSKKAHFCLPKKDPYFSRMHFLIEVNPPLCRLVDLKSKSGTLVNGERVASINLKDGDEIRGGSTVMKVQIQAPTVESPKAAADPVDLLDQVIADIAQRRRTGESPDLREYLERHPQLDGVLQLALQAEAPTVSARPQPDLPAIPGYRIIKELGHGGMGVVYHAQRDSDQRDVALKTIRAKIRVRPGTLERFIREASILSKLLHPHIVAFQDMGQVGPLAYFAMDLVSGTDASKLVKTQGPLSVGRATRIVVPVLDALAYAHAQGFVHRDLKPANILGIQNQGEDEVKVADFGLARAYQESPMSGLTMSDDVAGTPQYMPPEQVLHFRSVKPAGDQYAAAATLYFLLTARPPYEPAATAQEFYKRILQEEPVPIEQRRPQLPRELTTIIHRALAREPDQRFADVAFLRQALEPFRNNPF